jgi:hypothetical protein
VDDGMEDIRKSGTIQLMNGSKQILPKNTQPLIFSGASCTSQLITAVPNE